MVTHPFRAANLSGASPAQFAALFAPFVTLHPPILTKPVSGKDLVLPILAYATTLTGKPHSTLEIRADTQTVLLWQGTVDGYALQVATVLTDDPAGQIRDITILMRPYPLVTRFQHSMYQRFASSIPADHWVLAAEPANRPHHHAAAATLPPAARSRAPDVTLHSPVLTKEVRGKDQVAAVEKAVSAVATPRSYQATFSTPPQRIAVTLWGAVGAADAEPSRLGLPVPKYCPRVNQSPRSGTQSAGSWPAPSPGVHRNSSKIGRASCRERV